MKRDEMRVGIVSVLAVAMVAVCGCVNPNVRREAGVAYVDEFDLSAASCGYGKKVAKLEGKRGFYAHPESAVLFSANGRVTAFDAEVGIAPEAKSPYKSYGKPGATFRVWADGRVVFASHEFTAGMKPEKVHVDLKGAKEIILETRSGGLWKDFVAADCHWLDARFTCAEGVELESVTDETPFAQLGILTPAEKPEPQFNGADIWGVRPGHPVIFRIPVSGARPMTFEAKNLPKGVTLDEKGVLRGTAPAQKGDYDVTVTASNAHGKAQKVIRLAVGDQIALTPPMGWNSWNVWCYGLTAERAKASALAMEKSGLGDYGWSYVNLDDWWEKNSSEGAAARRELRVKELGDVGKVDGPARDAKGKILPNAAFPNMNELTDYIHSFGFKAGLYSSPGKLTCGGCEGSFGHELDDAASWADWGFDYIKYDWCSYSKEVPELQGKDWWGAKDKTWFTRRTPSKEKPYRLMNDCLRKQNRDILFSFCQYGMGCLEEWGRDAGANCARTYDDLKDGWAWMELAIDSRVKGDYWKWYGKGFWPDPDMMIVGQQRSYGHDHPTFLTPNEQYTHVSVWAMLASPLLTGCDLTKLDAFTRNLLANREVIAISQDRLGEVARRIRHVDAEDVWMKHLANGGLAVALVNRSPVLRNVEVSLADLGVSGTWKARDCWKQVCEGRVSGTYAAAVPPHATKLIRLVPVDCAKCE